MKQEYNTAIHKIQWM